MKKILSLVLALVLCLSFAACAKEEAKPDETDLEYVQNKDKLIVGVTEFEPMDYLDEDGEWVGFDADLAKAFAESLGVEVEFVKIDWDNKVAELKGKSIDCVWNGMTLTDEVKSAMSCSNAYCNNQQIVIVKAADAEKYTTIESLKDLTFAVEAGSAGEKVANENSFKTVPVVDQATTLSEVKGGTADAAIIDSLMAAAMVGEGTNYADLTYTLGLSDEEYGVGFRKDSNLTAALNDFFKQAYADGTMKKLAEKYGVEAAIVEQK